jgi:hypothetical protein
MDDIVQTSANIYNHLQPNTHSKETPRLSLRPYVWAFVIFSSVYNSVATKAANMHWL